MHSMCACEISRPAARAGRLSAWPVLGLMHGTAGHPLARRAHTCTSSWPGPAARCSWLCRRWWPPPGRPLPGICAERSAHTRAGGEGWCSEGWCAAGRTCVREGGGLASALPCGSGCPMHVAREAAAGPSPAACRCVQQRAHGSGAGEGGQPAAGERPAHLAVLVHVCGRRRAGGVAAEPARSQLAAGGALAADKRLVKRAHAAVLPLQPERAPAAPGGRRLEERVEQHRRCFGGQRRRARENRGQQETQAAAACSCAPPPAAAAAAATAPSAGSFRSGPPGGRAEGDACVVDTRLRGEQQNPGAPSKQPGPPAHTRDTQARRPRGTRAVAGRTWRGRRAGGRKAACLTGRQARKRERERDTPEPGGQRGRVCW